jgi:hypothetical protein
VSLEKLKGRLEKESETLAKSETIFNTMKKKKDDLFAE